MRARRRGLQRPSPGQRRTPSTTAQRRTCRDRAWRRSSGQHSTIFGMNPASLVITDRGVATPLRIGRDRQGRIRRVDGARSSRTSKPLLRTSRYCSIHRSHSASFTVCDRQWGRCASSRTPVTRKPKCDCSPAKHSRGSVTTRDRGISTNSSTNDCNRVLELLTDEPPFVVFAWGVMNVEEGLYALKLGLVPR